MAQSNSLDNYSYGFEVGADARGLSTDNIPLYIKKDQASATRLYIENKSTDDGAYAGFQANVDSSYGALWVFDDSFTDTAAFTNKTVLNAGTGSAGVVINFPDGSSTFEIWQGAGNLFFSITGAGVCTMPTVDINGGNIDGTTIGATTTAEGDFTNLTCSNEYIDNSSYPTLQWLTSGTARWTIGVDTGDNNALRIGSGSTLTSSPYMRMYNGFVTFPERVIDSGNGTISALTGGSTYTTDYTFTSQGIYMVSVAGVETSDWRNVSLVCRGVNGPEWKTVLTSSLTTVDIDDTSGKLTITNTHTQSRSFYWSVMRLTAG